MSGNVPVPQEETEVEQISLTQSVQVALYDMREDIDSALDYLQMVTGKELTREDCRMAISHVVAEREKDKIAAFPQDPGGLARMADEATAKRMEQLLKRQETLSKAYDILIESEDPEEANIEVIPGIGVGMGIEEVDRLLKQVVHEINVLKAELKPAESDSNAQSGPINFNLTFSGEVSKALNNIREPEYKTIEVKPDTE